MWRGADPTPLTGLGEERHAAYRRPRGQTWWPPRRAPKDLTQAQRRIPSCFASLREPLPHSEYCTRTEIITTPAGIGELQEAVDRLASGVRDRAAMRKAREDMNRMREETRRRIATVDLAVALVRDARQ